MVKTVRNRLIKFILYSAIILSGIGLVLHSLNNNIMFFFTPTEIPQNPPKIFRLGGLVKAGSVQHIDKSIIIFTVTDYKNDIEVQYQGALPMLFREGQGIVAKGSLSQGKFIAKELLAKHDEKYTPPNIIADK